MNAFQSLIFLAVLAAAAPAQAQQSSRDAGVYGNGNSMVQGSAQPGIVLDVRRVNIEASQTATFAGRGTGAAVGGALGSRLGKHTATHIVGGVLGGRIISVTQAGESQLHRDDPVWPPRVGGEK